MADNDFRATDLFPCNKNIFRPHDFPLAPEDTNAAPVNHPALVKTSDQQSFSSVYFSQLTFAEALRASDISAVPNLNLHPWWNSKKNRIHLTENLLGQLRKIKSSRPLYPKSIGLHRKFFFVLQKQRREGLPRSNSVWHFIRFEHWPSCYFRWWFNRIRGTRRWLCVLYRSSVWRPQRRRVDTVCEIVQMGHKLCVGMEDNFDCETIPIFVLVCILCICNFLNSVTILCAFCINYSASQIRKTCAPR